MSGAGVMAVVIDADERDRRVRTWLDAHPRTALYIAFVVTASLILQIVSLLQAG